MVAIYSTFLQRGYDQLIHDVALQNLPVVFALDRAGLVGSDGATHQGSYDLTFALYDAETAGNLIAGPLTNAATVVSIARLLDQDPGIASLFPGPVHAPRPLLPAARYAGVSGQTARNSRPEAEPDT